MMRGSIAFHKMKHVSLTLLVGIVSCAAASARDFATEMLEATFNLYHGDSTGTCVLVKREPPDQGLYLASTTHVLERTKG